MDDRMGRSTFRALLTSLLVAGLASPAVSAESEAADSRTTPIPGTGLAVVLPADWRVWSPPPAGEAIVIATDVRARQSCEFALVEGSRSAEGAAQETLETVEAHPDVEVVERTFLEVTAGTAVRVSYRYAPAPDEDRFILHEYYLSGPDGAASVPDVTDVDLFPWRTIRADWSSWRGMPATAWVFVDGERRIVLFCRADDPPADSWLSVAETFEFLPAWK